MFTLAREPTQFAHIPPVDGEVLGRVLNALYWDLAVPSDYLSVKVENGWVTISGPVAHFYQKSCAEADVRRVFGVRGVTNGIDVETTVSQAAGVPPRLAPIVATAQAAPR
jgi:osmotically-inducible protein OsmY